MSLFFLFILVAFPSCDVLTDPLIDTPNALHLKANLPHFQAQTMERSSSDDESYLCSSSKAAIFIVLLILILICAAISYCGWMCIQGVKTVSNRKCCRIFLVENFVELVERSQEDQAADDHVWYWNSA